MIVAFGFIGGLMFGVEILWGQGTIVFDLGVLRVMIMKSTSE